MQPEASLLLLQTVALLRHVWFLAGVCSKRLTRPFVFFLLGKMSGGFSVSMDFFRITCGALIVALPWSGDLWQGWEHGFASLRDSPNPIQLHWCLLVFTGNLSLGPHPARCRWRKLSVGGLNLTPALTSPT